MGPSSPLSEGGKAPPLPIFSRNRGDRRCPSLEVALLSRNCHNTPSRSGLPGAFRLQAQQRYRAKRKAQFNNMQHTIEELTGKLEAAQVR